MNALSASIRLLIGRVKVVSTASFSSSGLPGAAGLVRLTGERPGRAALDDAICISGDELDDGDELVLSDGVGPGLVLPCGDASGVGVARTSEGSGCAGGVGDGFRNLER